MHFPQKTLSARQERLPDMVSAGRDQVRPEDVPFLRKPVKSLGTKIIELVLLAATLRSIQASERFVKTASLATERWLRPALLDCSRYGASVVEEMGGEGLLREGGSGGSV